MISIQATRNTAGHNKNHTLWTAIIKKTSLCLNKGWRHPSLAKLKNSRTTLWIKRLTLTLLWNSNVPIVEHCMPRKLTVNCNSCCGLLEICWKPAIGSKHRSLLTGMLLHHSNMWLDEARATAEKIAELRLECPRRPDNISFHFGCKEWKIGYFWKQLVDLQKHTSQSTKHCWECWNVVAPRTNYGVIILFFTLPSLLNLWGMSFDLAIRH